VNHGIKVDEDNSFGNGGSKASHATQLKRMKTNVHAALGVGRVILQAGA
jgi:hypothetical protein